MILTLPLLLSAGLLLSCGGGGASAALTQACATTFKPCGGDITGTWSYVGECNPVSQTIGVADCPSIAKSGAPTLTTTYTFEADGSYTSNATETGTVTYTFSSSWAPASRCAAFDSTPTGPSDGLQMTTTCTAGAAGECACQDVYSGSEQGSGGYVTSGTTLNIANGPVGVSEPYCVSGDTLELATSNFFPGGDMPVAVFTRQ